MALRWIWEMLCLHIKGAQSSNCSTVRAMVRGELPKAKGPLMNGAMTNCWPLEKELGASKASQNSFVYKACK